MPKGPRSVAKVTAKAPNRARVTVLKTSRAMWILFGAPYPTVALMAAVAAVVTDRGFWIVAIVLGLFSAVLLSWLRTARLVLTDQAVHYRALLVRKDLPLPNIIGAKMEFGIKGSGPIQRVVFDVSGAPKHTKITINAGLFDGRQCRQWVETLNDRLATVAQNSN
jgi:hypothetical protein